MAERGGGGEVTALDQLFNVLGENVDLKVNGLTNGALAEGRVLPSIDYQGDGEGIRKALCDCEASAIDADEALGDDVGEEVGGGPDFHDPGALVGGD